MKAKTSFFVVLSFFSLLLFGCGLQTSPKIYSTINIKDYINTIYSEDESTANIIDDNTPLGSYETGIVYAASVKPIEKINIIKDNGKRGVVCSYSIENYAKNDIVRIDGDFIIKSDDEKEILRVETTFDNINCPAQKTITIENYGFDIDDSVEFQKTIFDSDLSDLTCEFEVKNITFSQNQ